MQKTSKAILFFILIITLTSFLIGCWETTKYEEYNYSTIIKKNDKTTLSISLHGKFVDQNDRKKIVRKASPYYIRISIKDHIGNLKVAQVASVTMTDVDKNTTYLFNKNSKISEGMNQKSIEFKKSSFTDTNFTALVENEIKLNYTDQLITFTLVLCDKEKCETSQVEEWLRTDFKSYKSLDFIDRILSV